MNDQYMSLFEQAETARKYIQITEVQGPSQQLLDFINYDGKLGHEIGLESFNTFSTQAQHEILLSKLDPDTLDQMAMEGFMGTLKKYGAWLLGAGALATVTGILAPIGIPLIIAGSIGVISKAGEKTVPTYKSFTTAAKQLDAAVNQSNNIVNGIPSGFDKGAWESFKGKLDDTKFIEPDTSYEHTAFDNSGWDVGNFSSGTKHIVDKAKQIDEIKKSLAGKLSSIEKKADEGDEVAKIAAKCLADIKKSITACDKSMAFAEILLKGVMHCFEAKKK